MDGVDYFWVVNPNLFLTTHMAWPSTFLTRMEKQLGDDFSHFLHELNTPAPISFRWNSAKDERKLDFAQVPWAENAYYLPERPIFTLDPLFHAGLYYVQEASSMFLSHVLKEVKGNEEGVKILDLCGAPGGKSTLLASLLPEDGLLVTNEVIRGRAQILVENIQKWGNPNVVVSNNDPRDFQSLEGFFDVMVVDAPCSGEGLFRRDPKAAEEWSPANVQLCVDRQRRILMDAWDCLKPDGILIYSTCTYNLEENEDNLKWLSEQVELESLEIELKEEWKIFQVEANGIWGYRFFPHRTKGEGLFMAALKKLDGRKYKAKKRKAQPFGKPSKEESEEVREWFSEGREVQLYKDGEEIFAFPTAHKKELMDLEEKLRLIHKGIPLAEAKKKNLVPLHALAMSTALKPEAFSRVKLEQEEALIYLSKNALQRNMEKGWNLMTFEGHSLGWGKQVNQRMNNYYPQHWRIRMGVGDREKWFLMK